MKRKFILQWHITHKCNLRCSHCYQNEYDNHMSEDDFLKSLDKFEEYIKTKNYKVQINLTGGEPLSHPNFFEFVNSIKKKNYNFAVLSNGTLIDEEKAQQLSLLEPVFVQISLDGTEKYHDSIRGEGNFKKSLEAIDYLKKFGVKVLVSFTAQKNNLYDFENLAKICKKHKVDKLWWDRVVTDNEKDHKNLALSTEEFEYLVNKTKTLIKKYSRFGRKNFVSNTRALQFCEEDFVGYECSAGKNLLIFTADGSVMPCRRLPFVIGNIFEENLRDIIDKSEIIKELKNRDSINECMRCNHYFKCRGGAKCVTYAQTGKPFVKDINCFYKK